MPEVEDSNYDDVSKEELIQQLEELYEELKEKEDTIQTLTTESLKKGKKGKSGDAELVLQISSLETDNDALREKLVKSGLEVTQYKEKVADLGAQLKQVESEKGQIEGDLRLARLRHGELEAEITKKNEMHEDMVSKYNDALKTKGFTQKNQLQLLQENETLTNKVIALEAKLQSCAVKESEMDEVIVNLANEKDALEVSRDQWDMKEKESNIRIIEMEREMKILHNQLESLAEVESQRETDMQALSEELNGQSNKHFAEIRVHKADIAKLQKELNSLRDTTMIGEKQKEIEQLQRLNMESNELVDDLRHELEILLPEKEQLIERVLSYEENIESRIYDRIALETEKNRMLEKKIAGLSMKIAEEKTHFEQLEKEKDYLAHDLEEANHWKSVYEGGNGLTELARNQKRVKEDNRRLTITLEQMAKKLGESMENNGILVYSFDKLKSECGKGAEFTYDKHQIQEEMLGENVKLKSQLYEVELQIDSLETECIRLRRVLKHQAGAIGEQGFKFTGLSSEQLIKINEYAMNMRDGVGEVPKEDRPVAILKENAKLKEDIKMLNLLIERQERELAGVGSNAYSNNSKPSPLSPVKPQPRTWDGVADNSTTSAPSMSAPLLEMADMAALKEGMQQVLHENNELRVQMFKMQDELVKQLKVAQSQQQPHNQSHSHAQPHQHPPMNRAGSNNQVPLTPVNTRTANAHHVDLTPIAQVSATPESPLFSSMIQHQAAASKPVANTPISILKNTTVPKPNNDGAIPGVPYQQLYFNAKAKHTHIEPENNMFFSPPSSTTSSPASPAKPHHEDMHFPMSHQEYGYTSTLSARNSSFGSIAFPPEDYAEQIKELNVQLVECLEKLKEREADLVTQANLTSNVEHALVKMKQQMSIVYYDYQKKVNYYEDEMKKHKEENSKLLNASEDMKIRLKGIEHTMEMDLKAMDPSGLDAKILQLSKKLVQCDVNELVYSRKYTTLSEQLQQEQNQRIQLQYDIAEIEGSYKKRILYLEQYKSVIGTRLSNLQVIADTSVPQDNYMAIQAELENLRDDHLLLLRRDIDQKISTLTANQTQIELKQLKSEMQELRIAYEKEKETCQHALAQLEMQKELLDKYVTTSAGSGHRAVADTSRLISEMARYKGEASRLEVELTASKRRVEDYSFQNKSMAAELEKLTKKTIEISDYLEESTVKERIARKTAMELTLKVEGGVDKETAEVMTRKISLLEKQLEESRLETIKQKELADIAFLQAETIASFRKQNQEELTSMRDYCTQVESKGDDDFLIGKLQRLLMTTKNSYKAFVRKYHLLRTNVRQRELVQRVLEARLDQREEALAAVQETHRIEVLSLKQALQSLQDVNINIDLHGTASATAEKKDSKNGNVIRTLTRKVNELTQAADYALKRAVVLEDECKTLRTNSQALTENNKKQLVTIDELQKQLNRITNKSAADINADVLFQNLFDCKPDSRPAGLPKGNIDIKDTALLQTQNKALKSEIDTLQHTITNLKSLVEEKSHTIDRLKATQHSQPTRSNKHDMDNENAMAVESVDDIFKSANQKAASGQPGNKNQYAIMKKEQEKIQEAASATIGSLKSLLEEKNEMLSKCERKIGELQFELARAHHPGNGITGGRIGSIADRQADAILQELDRDQQGGRRREDDVDAIGKGKTANRLHKANDELFNVITEKDGLINRLEERLAAETNQRERAETRCGSALNEMEAMRNDIITLVNQLRESEQHIQSLNSQTPFPKVQPTSQPANTTVPTLDFKDRDKVINLQNAVKAKDKKMKDYRNIIVKLKNEFMRQEEIRAQELSATAKPAPAAAGGASNEELQVLRKQVAALRDGLSQAKEEMEKHRKSREKLSVALKAAEDRSEGFEKEMQNAQELAATAQQALVNCRKDRDDSIKKEIRMREKLKEFLSDDRDKANADAPADSLSKQMNDYKEKIKQLEKNAEILKIQNQALRRGSHAGGDDRHHLEDRDREPASHTADIRPLSAPHATTKEPLATKGHSNTLGSRGDEYLTHSPQDENPLRDLRSEKHAKWEDDKKLQSRVGVLNKRVKELDEENNSLRAQLKEWKEKAGKEMQSKQDTLKHHAASLKRNHSDADTHKPSSHGDMYVMEELRQRIYELEEENAKWKRKAELDLGKEITALRHQASVANSQKADMEDRVEELEMRLKQQHDFHSSSGTNKLRQSEDKYLKEQKLRDELDLLRKHKIELESVLLDRETHIMEMRFEEEQNHLEVERLRRRNKEVEGALKVLKSQLANLEPSESSHSLHSPAGKAHVTKKPTAETESDRQTIETMGRMIEELRKENNRLKSTRDTGLGDKRLAALEKTNSSEKKKLESMQAEYSKMENKLKEYADSEQTLVQRQQRITSLQKQLKKQQEEYLFIKSEFDRVTSENESMNDEIASLKKQIATGEYSGPKPVVSEKAMSLMNSESQRQLLDKEAQLTRKESELTSLRNQLQQVQNELKTSQLLLNKKTNMFDDEPKAGSIPPHVLAEMRELKAENARMKEELDVLDADFFDEIENLKYNYAESAKKLAEYEKKYGPLITSSSNKNANSRR